MTAPRFKAACAQLTSTDDRDANLSTCRKLAADAAEKDVKLLAFPECFGFLAAREQDKFAVAEILDPERPGPILETAMGIAREHQMWVVGGGIAEVLPEQEGGETTRTYNTCVLLSPEGELAARYRKIHLFDVDIPGKAQLAESDTTARGQELVSIKTPVGKLGLSICYDLRFPELYRKLALDDGAEVLLVPSAFTAHTGAAHWHTLLRARAIENQCFVVAPGQVGRHNAKRNSYGHSLIIDPWGEILAEIEDGTGLAVAEIDLGRLEETRQRMPCLRHQTLQY
jgi:predicted amidohydrolase